MVGYKRVLEKIKENYPTFILLFLVLFRFDMAPDVSNRYPGGGDAASTVHLAEQFHEHWFDFWDTSQGNGTPARRFYPPLAGFVIALLANILPFLVAYNLVFALSFVLVPIFYYLWLRDLKLSKIVAAIATILFSLSSIHYASILYTGALTRIFSYNLLLLYLIFVQRAIRKESSVIYALIFFCLTALAYYPAAYFATGVSLIYFLVYWYDNRKEGYSFLNIKKLIFIFLISGLLLAFWFLPIIIESKMIGYSPSGASGENFFMDTLNALVHTSGSFFFANYNAHFSPLTFKLFDFIGRLYFLALLFTLFYFFKELRFSLFSLLFAFNILNLRLSFYISEHRLLYGLMFISFIVAFGIYQFYERLKNNYLWLAFFRVLLVISLLVFASFFYKYSENIFSGRGLGGFDISYYTGFEDLANFLKDNKIDKVYSCGVLGTLNLDAYGFMYSYMPQLLNDYGIRTLNAYLFSTYPGAPLIHRSIPDFSRINNSKELYDTLALRDVDAVLLGIADPKYNPECYSLGKQRLYDARYFNKVDISHMLNSQMETWLLSLKEKPVYLNCNKPVEYTYLRDKPTEFKLNFSTHAKDIECVLAESYYPRWSLYRNGKERVKLGSREGLMTFNLDNLEVGNYFIFRYERRWYHIMGMVISLIALLSLLVFSVRKNTRRFMWESG